MRKTLILAGILSIGFAYAQEGNVGINTDQPKATLEITPNSKNSQVNSTSNEGVIIPKLTKERVSNIITPIEGTLVYVIFDDTLSNTFSNAAVSDINNVGFYYFSNGKWRYISRFSPWFSTTYNQPATNFDKSIYHLGFVGIGTNSLSNALTIHGTDWKSSSAVFRRVENNHLPSGISLQKARSNAADSTVLEGDHIGAFVISADNERFINNIAGIWGIAAKVESGKKVAGELQFKLMPSGVINTQEPEGEDNGMITRMVLNSAGNLGLGIDKPVYRLDVSGRVRTVNVILTQVPVHANDTEAGNAGLITGTVYRTPSGDLKIKL